MGAALKGLTTKLAMSLSFTVHGRQHDTKYVTFELLLHAAFVAGEISGFMREPARTLRYKYMEDDVRPVVPAIEKSDLDKGLSRKSPRSR